MQLRYFFSDLGANLIVAAVSVFAVYWLIPQSWPMFGAMYAAMAVGMLVAEVLCVFVLMRLFGDAEVMLPCMVTGMAAGMYVGMAVTMSAPGLGQYLLVSGGIALAVCVSVYTLNTWLRGPVRNP